MFNTHKIEMLEQRIKSMESDWKFDTAVRKNINREQELRIGFLTTRLHAMAACLNMHYIDPSTQDPFYVIENKEPKA